MVNHHENFALVVRVEEGKRPTHPAAQVSPRDGRTSAGRVLEEGANLVGERHEGGPVQPSSFPSSVRSGPDHTLAEGEVGASSLVPQTTSEVPAPPAQRLLLRVRQRTGNVAAEPVCLRESCFELCGGQCGPAPSEIVNQDSEGSE